MDNSRGIEVEYNFVLEELEYERKQFLIDEQEYRETRAVLEEEYQQKINEAISVA